MKDSSGYNDFVVKYSTLCTRVCLYITDEMFDNPIAEFANVTVSRIVHNCDEPVPFMLRRLVSRKYHIGPAGAVIGFSPEADICLPQEAGLLERHVQIKGNSGRTSTVHLGVAII